MYKLVSSYRETDEQRRVIDEIVDSVKKGNKFTTLLGVTGSGKTFVMAKVIEKLNLPALVIAPNKVLAAQLFSEFKNFLPYNRVEYFISFYDFYRPESYVPSLDLYLEKEAVINMYIDKLRHRATQAVISDKNTVIVASVSCIYNIGSPEEYMNAYFNIYTNQQITVDEITHKLVSIYYEQDNYELKPGKFRVRGNNIIIFPQGEDNALLIELNYDIVENIYIVNPIDFKKLRKVDLFTIYPAKMFITTENILKKALKEIQNDLEERYNQLIKEGRLVEAHRLRTRVEYDLAMLSKFGTCPGIENYSRYLSNRPPNSPPYTLLHYFKDKFLTFIDESHITISQLKGMYFSDKNRKETLIEYGFRLPSCLDNRPLKFEEFLEFTHNIVFVSATPGDFELSNSNKIVELLVRPTGLVDPEIIILNPENMAQKILNIINDEKSKGNRVIVNVLTQKMAEDFCEYLIMNGVKASYIHSKVEPLDRIKILTDFRKGIYDCLVGVNLLREGLDLPEVSVVIITDGDKQGFLRSKNSIIQLAGRAARNLVSKVIIFANEITKAIQEAINETNRRREYQLNYNKTHKIEPKPLPSKPKDIIKMVFEMLGVDYSSDNKEILAKLDLLINEEELILMDDEVFIEYINKLSDKKKKELKQRLTKYMKTLADNMDFEKAIVIREKLKLF
jgi:excinuclease ABC subunit B